jgi:hypothetical protein
MGSNSPLPSIKNNIKTELPITTKESIITANALFTESVATSRPKESILSFPLLRLIMLSKATDSVVTLIPPPVDPGAAPIHISIITSNNAGSCKDAVSMVLNPAVRGVAAPKKAVIILPKPSWLASVLSYSIK